MNTRILSIILSTFLLNCGSSNIIETSNESASSTTEALKEMTNDTKQPIEDSIAEQKQLLQSNDSPLGIWEITTETPRGNKFGILTITEENGKLKGKTDNDIFAISKNGNTLSWTSEIDTPMGSIDIENEVEVNGNKMSGNAKMSSGRMVGRSMKITGVKK